jgi:hypothetical protein
MGRALGVPLSFILVLFICVYFIFLRITGVDQAPANLDDYPDEHIIKANLSNFDRALGALFEPPPPNLRQIYNRQYWRQVQAGICELVWR